jgi:pyroglutamyl-peptidase
MRNVLVTGFEPFGGEMLNPSALAAQKLDGTVVAGRLVAGAVLPCVFGESFAVLRREMERVQPELVICTGQAGGRAAVSVERVAVNLENADIPDNAGNQPMNNPVVPGGPAAYSSTLPIEAIVAALRQAGLPGEISESAGTFVCNHLFYGLMRTLAAQPAVRGGFIHLPYLPEQGRRAGCEEASLPLEQIVRGLEIAIAISLTAKRDLHAGGRTIC